MMHSSGTWTVLFCCIFRNTDTVPSAAYCAMLRQELKPAICNKRRMLSKIFAAPRQCMSSCSGGNGKPVARTNSAPPLQPWSDTMWLACLHPLGKVKEAVQTWIHGQKKLPRNKEASGTIQEGHQIAGCRNDNCYIHLLMITGIKGHAAFTFWFSLIIGCLKKNFFWSKKNLVWSKTIAKKKKTP